MATAAVDASSDDHHLNHLHSESIPLIDLRLFSQSELFSLSLCSASSSLHHHQNDPDVSTLKIDRSVFNESAGGRKQTFSRLRLAPRSNSQFSPSSSIPLQTAEQTLEEDSPQIVALLKSMFGGKSVEVSNIDDNLVSAPVQYDASLLTNDVVQNITAMGVSDSTTKKRKRGKPRRDESNSTIKYINYNFNEDVERTAPNENCKVEKEEELVRINANATTTELEKFGTIEDPYARELNRRTLDMQTREQLLEFLQGLDGEWLSSRKKRKIVGASSLGDFLPNGWKLMLCMKKRAGYFWVDCGGYISPNGQQFMSCKEASSYLNSSLGLQDTSQLNSGPVDGNIQITEKKTSGNAVDLTLIADKNEGALVCCPGFPLREPAVQCGKESTKVGIPRRAETVRKYRCHKCTMVFDEPDDLLQHLLSSHQKVPKRVRQETSMNEEVIFKNGKYECQFCDKSFDERRRYYGHLGNHIKDYFKRIQTSGEAIRIQRSTVHPLVAVNPSAVKIQESTEVDVGSVSVNSNIQNNDEINNDALECSIKENVTDESYCQKQGLVCIKIDDKPGDSNDIVAVEANSVQKGSPKCSFAAVRMEQIRSADNSENQHVNLIRGPQELGSDSNLVAPRSVQNGEIVKDQLLSSAINSREIHDRDFVGADQASTCSTEEDVGANSIEQIDLKGYLLIPCDTDQKHASVKDVHRLSASITVEMTSERVSQVDLSSPLDEKAGISNDKVNQVCTTSMEKSRDDGMGCSSNNILTAGFGSKNATVEDFVTGNEFESSCGNSLIFQTWVDQTSYVEKDTVAKNGQEKKSGGRQLTLFGSEQCFDSEDSITKASNDTREVPDHGEVLYVRNSMHSKGVDLIAHVTDVELESSSGNSLLAPSGNELTFSLKENEVPDGATKNLAQDKVSDSSHKPSCDDQILDHGNNVKLISLATVDQSKHKEVKSFFKGDPHIAFDCSHVEWDAGDVKRTIQESYSNGCSLVASGSQWNVIEDNVTGQSCSPLDEQKKASAKGLFNLSNSLQDWRPGNNLGRVLTVAVKEKLQVIKPRKNDAVIGFSSNIQASDNVMSDFMWRHDEESDLLGSFNDTSRVAHSSGCFTTYDLFSDKGGNELFGDKFSGLSGFGGLRSSNMENMEYNFMSNHSEESKIFSDDTEITQGLGSSAWLEREALPLLPKIASRQHVTAFCVWCKNEYHYDDFVSETQTVPQNFTCAACKAKFSSNFNLM